MSPAEPLDAVTLEIVWTRLISAVDEAAKVIVRTSFSTLSNEANDFACVITDADGRSLAQNSGSIPSFIACLPATVKHFLARMGRERMRPGDVLITNNPWDARRSSGGSSGGSAAAVAADECVAALGSDTGGSIRQPAAFCGVVGLKPTYGRVSRYGLIAFASSLDQIGPITKDVADAAFLLGAIAGHDPKDSTSADLPVPDYMKALKKKDVKKLKFGVPAEFFAEGLDPEVEAAVRAAIDELKSLGGEIKEIQLPRTDAAVAVYYVLATAEASSNLARYDGVKFGLRAKDTKDLLDLYTKTRQEGFGPEVKRRIAAVERALTAANLREADGSPIPGTYERTPSPPTASA